VTDQAEYVRVLREVRGRGYALDEGEQELGVRCVAVALDGGPSRAALSISGPTTRMTDELIERAVPHLTRAARDLLADLDQAKR
jgi:IclR family acetate operon transcriptional repressor